LRPDLTLNFQKKSIRADASSQRQLIRSIKKSVSNSTGSTATISMRFSAETLRIQKLLPHLVVPTPEAKKVEKPAINVPDKVAGRLIARADRRLCPAH